MINENLLEIIRADKAARAKVSDAAASGRDIEQRLEKARAEFEKKYSALADKQTASSAAAHEKELARAEADYQKHLEKISASIDELAKRQKGHWVDEIVRAVTGA